jgi:hypothetical protein
MAYARFDGGLDQGTRVHRVVTVVGERIANRVRHDHRGGEMDNRIDSMLGDQFGHERLIAGVADGEQGALRYRPIEPGCKVVEHHHPFPGLEEGVNHVASDIAGAAGDQDRHAGGPLMCLGAAACALVSIRSVA